MPTSGSVTCTNTIVTRSEATCAVDSGETRDTLEAVHQHQDLQRKEVCLDLVAHAQLAPRTSRWHKLVARPSRYPQYALLMR
jgi:hypothetical protein